MRLLCEKAERVYHVHVLSKPRRVLHVPLRAMHRHCADKWGLCHGHARQPTAAAKNDGVTRSSSNSSSTTTTTTTTTTAAAARPAEDPLPMCYLSTTTWHHSHSLRRVCVGGGLGMVGAGEGGEGGREERESRVSRDISGSTR